MYSSKLRRQLAWAAARFLYLRQETDWFQARSRAVRQMVRGWVPPADMPQRADIQEQLTRMMQQSAEDVARLADTWSDAATAPPETKERREDRWQLYASLLYPLEGVKLPRKDHPEGDALYHSLQVFELARQEVPYDEEALLAALLHAVGEALDRHDPMSAALAALGETISKRTQWLMTHLEQAAGLFDGTIGSRARRRLSCHEDYDELVILARCDKEGRQRGAVVPTVAEAIGYLKSLSEQCEGEWLSGDALE